MHPTTIYHYIFRLWSRSAPQLYITLYIQKVIKKYPTTIYHSVYSGCDQGVPHYYLSLCIFRFWSQCIPLLSITKYSGYDQEVPHNYITLYIQKVIKKRPTTIYHSVYSGCDQDVPHYYISLCIFRLWSRSTPLLYITLYIQVVVKKCPTNIYDSIYSGCDQQACCSLPVIWNLPLSLHNTSHHWRCGLIYSKIKTRTAKNYRPLRNVDFLSFDKYCMHIYCTGLHLILSVLLGYAIAAVTSKICVSICLYILLENSWYSLATDNFYFYKIVVRIFCIFCWNILYFHKTNYFLWYVTMIS